MQRKHLYSTIALSLSLAAVGVWAAGPPSFTIPHTFSANTPARAAEVNANFTALENQIVYLNDQLVAQQTTINNLQTQLSAVQGSNIMKLDPYVDQVDVPDPVDSSILYPTIQFAGANLQIVNGTGVSHVDNGLGNLIIGYNKPDVNEVAFCSDGRWYADQGDCLISGAIWAKNQRSGSHNLVLGDENSYTSHGGMVAGARNIINRNYAVVLGGFGNMASGEYASVTAGLQNVASGRWSSVSGGRQNAASGYSDAPSVSGGFNITADGQDEWCGGGTTSAPNCH